MKKEIKDIVMFALILIVVVSFVSYIMHLGKKVEKETKEIQQRVSKIVAIPTGMPRKSLKTDFEIYSKKLAETNRKNADLQAKLADAAKADSSAHTQQPVNK